MLSLVAAMVAVPASAKNIAVTINNEKLNLKHKPKMVKKQVMLPAQEVFEALGADVEWVKQDQLMIATKGTRLITLKVKSDKLRVADLTKGMNKTIILKRVPKLVKGTVYVSPEVIKKAFNTKVKWNAKKKKAMITVKS